MSKRDPYNPERCGEICQTDHNMTGIPIAEHHRLLSDPYISEEEIHAKGLNEEYCFTCKERRE